MFQRSLKHHREEHKYNKKKNVVKKPSGKFIGLKTFWFKVSRNKGKNILNAQFTSAEVKTANHVASHQSTTIGSLTRLPFDLILCRFFFSFLAFDRPVFNNPTVSNLTNNLENRVRNSN